MKIRIQIDRVVGEDDRGYERTTGHTDFTTYLTEIDAAEVMNVLLPLLAEQRKTFMETVRA